MALALGLLALPGCSGQLQARADKVALNQPSRASSGAGLATVPRPRAQGERDCYNYQTFVDDCSGFPRANLVF